MSSPDPAHDDAGGRGRWVLLYAVVATITVVFVLLGSWQLRRWDEARARADAVDAGLAAAPAPLEQVLDGPLADAEALRYRRVHVRGTFVPDEEVLWRNRSLRGQQGFHVLTPLRVAGRDAAAAWDTVLVDRGWVPSDRDEPPVADAAPPAGTVTVTGYLLPSIDQPGFGARDAAEGRLARVFNVDLARLQAQVDGRLAPMFVVAQDLSPGAADADLPAPLDPPEVDTTQNLSYAVQWFAFAVIAVVATTAFALRRRRPAPA